jgi:hypothetical protein
MLFLPFRVAEIFPLHLPDFPSTLQASTSFTLHFQFQLAAVFQTVRTAYSSLGSSASSLFFLFIYLSIILLVILTLLLLFITSSYFTALCFTSRHNV